MHALSCIMGGLIIECHNKVRDKLFYLSQRSFTSSYVGTKPLIHQGRTRSELEIRQGSDKHKDSRGDVTIQGLWDRQVESLIYVKLGDDDVDTYKYEAMTSLLARWENIKKDKHCNQCHDQRKHFPPFFLSVDGMLGREALVEISQLSRVMGDKR